MNKLPTPACTAGVCQQGQRACPCPAACQLPIDDEARAELRQAQATDRRVEELVIVVVCLAALVAALMPAFV